MGAGFFVQNTMPSTTSGERLILPIFAGSNGLRVHA